MTSTTLAKKSGWPGKKPGTKTPVNIDAIRKTSAPYTPDRVIKEHKYPDLFAGVKEGDCFECPDAVTMAAMARALRLYLVRQGCTGVVRQSARTEDGVPRVWCLKIFQKGGSK